MYTGSAAAPTREPSMSWGRDYQMRACGPVAALSRDAFMAMVRAVAK